MDVRWDPAKARENRRKHGIRFSEAEAVLYDPRALTIEDPDVTGEARYISIGHDSRSRIVVAVYTYRDEHVRLISARRATRQERTAYEKGI
ncbi:MAG: BrnT family toxin [Thiohalobacterales bacterium]|nr:BrnT family toxin [Thiohalobacterales bacterium]